MFFYISILSSEILALLLSIIHYAKIKNKNKSHFYRHKKRRIYKVKNTNEIKKANVIFDSNDSKYMYIISNNCPIESKYMRSIKSENIIPLDSKKLTFGRDRNTDVFLNDKTISRNHFIIEKLDDGLFLKDSQSTNGTFLNDERVTTEKRKISVGDKIQAGSAELVVKSQA